MATTSTLTRRRPGALVASGPSQVGARLRQRLVEAGPLAASFGLYLGSRIDLFAGTDCRELLAITDAAPASDPGLVSDLIDRELGGPPESVFDDFDPQPLDSGLLCQWHRAQVGGEPATVELIHPEIDLRSGRLQRVVERSIAAGELPAAAREAVVEFERSLDLAKASAALRDLAEESGDLNRLEIPSAPRRLSGARVRVLCGLEEDDGQRSPTVGARRLARIWLTLVLRSDLFPVRPWNRNVAFVKGGKVAILGSELHRLPRGKRAELREYLAAVAAREPARAADAFLDLLPETPTARRLRDGIRHSDPFRDRHWDVGGDLFARQVLAHWKCAEQLGYPLPASLLPFYQGLFVLNQEVDRLAGDAASIRNGFREARLLVLLGEISEDGELRRLTGTMERQIGLVSALPGRLNRMLTLVSKDERLDGESGANGRGWLDREREPRSGVWAPVSACLVALGAVALLSRHLVDAGSLGPWAERIGAMVVLVLGGILLGIAARRGGD